jgi:hypothetical protein
MFSSSVSQISTRFAEKRSSIVAGGVVIAAAVALLFGDAHSIGMTFN